MYPMGYGGYYGYGYDRTMLLIIPAILKNIKISVAFSFM